MNQLTLSRGILYLACALSLVFGVSMAFAGSTPATDDQILGATFGAGMGIFGLGLVHAAFRDRPGPTYAALWYLPVFFVVHLAAFGAWVPDLPLLLGTTFALLVRRREMSG